MDVSTYILYLLLQCFESSLLFWNFFTNCKQGFIAALPFFYVLKKTEE